MLPLTHILAVYSDGSVGAVPQSNVQHCTVLHTQRRNRHVAIVTSFRIEHQAKTVLSVVAVLDTTTLQMYMFLENVSAKCSNTDRPR